MGRGSRFPSRGPFYAFGIEVEIGFAADRKIFLGRGGGGDQRDQLFLGVAQLRSGMNCHSRRPAWRQAVASTVLIRINTYALGLENRSRALSPVPRSKGRIDSRSGAPAISGSPSRKLLNSQIFIDLISQRSGRLSSKFPVDSLIRELNSLLSRINSLLCRINSLFCCAGNFSRPSCKLLNVQMFSDMFLLNRSQFSKKFPVNSLLPGNFVPVTGNSGFRKSGQTPRIDPRLGRRGAGRSMLEKYTSCSRPPSRP